MPKRHTSDDNEETNRKWRRVIIYSDSDESEQSDSDQRINQEIPEVPDPPPLQERSPHPEEPTAENVPPAGDPVLEEPLDAELLAALGDPAEEIPDFGENILQDLAQRLLPVLRKGLPKETKESILKDNTLPGNCRLLRAPSLNPEIAAAMSDVSRARDKRLKGNQNQLGLGISAVSRDLSLLITPKEDQAKQARIKAIKTISDGCKILADVYYNQSQSRVKLIYPVLDKSFLHIIKDVERDDTLFGCKLSEKIKATKAIEKQGLQIKKPLGQRNSTTLTPATASTSSQGPCRPRNQGNWTASSRYPSSSRGRGGAQRFGTATRRPQSSTPVGKTSGANKQQRAPAR